MMNESENLFEKFITRFYVKFGKLQIRGFHGKSALPSFRNIRSGNQFESKRRLDQHNQNQYYS